MSMTGILDQNFHGLTLLAHWAEVAGIANLLKALAVLAVGLYELAELVLKILILRCALHPSKNFQLLLFGIIKVFNLSVIEFV